MNHTDTTGPIAPPDMEGNLFLQLAVDVATSEEPEMILKGTRKLELAVGMSVKRYHPDISKYQHTKVLINQLESKRTQVTSTAPNISEQSAFVERRFESLFVTAK